MPPGCLQSFLFPSFRPSVLPSFRLPSGRPPEPPQCPHVRRVPQLLEGALSDLADTLAGDTEELADLLECECLGAFLQAVVQAEDLALARREVPLEDAVDELALQPAVGLLLDLAATGAGHPLAERAGAPVLPLDRGVERDLGGGHAAGAPDGVHGLVERRGDFRVG